MAKLLADEARSPGRGAARMASGGISEQGDCLTALGRLEEAAHIYEQAIALSERLRDERTVGLGKGQLATVRLLQLRFHEALAAYTEARKRFATLGEPASVAIVWHQIGISHERSGNGAAAEDAYRQSLAINVQLGSVGGQASTLNQLGLLYADVLVRREDGVAHYIIRRRNATSRCRTWPAKAGPAATSQTRCAASSAWPMPAARSSARSSASGDWGMAHP